MSICDNCIHLNVCGHEGVEDEAMKYCADKEERPNEYEWCNGCKEHDAENHCCHRLSNFIHTQAQEIHDMAYEEGKNDRPQGEWITFPTNHSIMQCPECTALLNNSRTDVFKDKIGNMNYCPNCGADMRKGGAE